MSEHRIVMAAYAAPSIYYVACERNGLEFSSGDIVKLLNPGVQLDHNLYIASSPLNEANLEFYFRTPSAEGLKRENIITISEPTSLFTPGKECNNGEYVFIAEEVGISPFLSALGFYTTSPFIILFEGKTKENLIEGWKLSTDYKCFFAISQEDLSKSPARFSKSISSYLPTLPTADKNIKYYICCSDILNNQVVSYLFDKAVAPEQIHIGLLDVGKELHNS